jgi:hypothetical protein
MCQILGVSTSGYYYWLKHPVGVRESKEQELLFHLDKIYQKSNSPSITVELQEQGIRVSRPRVARLMQKTGIRSIVRQKYRVQTTDSDHNYRVAENHLNRDFSTGR